MGLQPIKCTLVRNRIQNIEDNKFTICFRTNYSPIPNQYNSLVGNVL